jgi:hypothetical protein
MGMRIGVPHGAQRLLSFTGLIPVVLTLPILLLQWWTLGILMSLVSGASVIAFHLRRGQEVSGLDALTFCFGAVNAVLYFGWRSTVLLAHLDAVIYTALFAQVLISALRHTAWTTQFASRSVAPELWSSPAFLAGNRFVSLLWGVAFFASDVACLAGQGDFTRRYLPVALMLGTAILTPRAARWYGLRVTTSSTGQAFARAPRPAASGREPAVPARSSVASQARAKWGIHVTAHPRRL